MNLLLDTHVVLWAMYAHENLPPAAVELINAPGNRLYVSAASIWEVAIKYSLKRDPSFDFPPQEVKELVEGADCVLLPVSAEDAVILGTLPSASRAGAKNSDPFDRILIAQAISHKLVLVTHDAEITKYRQWVGEDVIQAI